MARPITGTVYLTVKRHAYYPNELTVVKATNSEPDVIPSGCRVVKFKITLRPDTFDAIDLGAIDVPEEAFIPQVVVPQDGAA